MADAGWYPDPGGDPTRERYWNGTTWTETLRPVGAAGSAPGTVPSGAPPRSSRRGPILLILVGLLVVALIVGVAYYLVSNIGGSGSGRVTPSSSVSVWDEGATPSSTPTSSGSTEPSAVVCPNLPRQRDQHVSDDKLHGGQLVALIPAGFTPSASRVSTSAQDAAVALKSEGGGWQSFVEVGKIPREFFGTPEKATDLLLQCHVTSSNFQGRKGQTETASQAFPVDGRDGWYRQTTVASSSAPGGGATYDIVVVDTGDPEFLSFYWSGVTLNDTDALGAVADGPKSLTVGN